MDKHDDIRIQQLEAMINELKRENARLKAQVEEYKNKEQSISSAIIASMEHANQLEASRKKLYSLDIQRSRLMYLRMEHVINELYAKYPELKKDCDLKEMSEKFKSLVFSDLNESNKEVNAFDVKKQPIVDDPIKKLLHNIINCFDSKKVEEEKTDEADEDLLNSNSQNGFDFNEALHPTMELGEIMKSFNLKKDNKQN